MRFRAAAFSPSANRPTPPISALRTCCAPLSVALLERMSNDFDKHDLDRLPLTHENRPIYISYIFLAATIILVGSLHLATPLLTVLFCFFVINKQIGRAS